MQNNIKVNLNTKVVLCLAAHFTAIVCFQFISFNKVPWANFSLFVSVTKLLNYA